MPSPGHQPAAAASSTAPESGQVELAHCAHCGAWSSPSAAWGCRRCGMADALSRRPPPQDAVLLEFITVHAALTPSLPVPCVVGEVQLAPGVVEEALIASDGEQALAHGMRLRPEPAPASTGVAWWFRPVEGQA